MYSRFKALKGFGKQELERLQNSTAAVVGLGATGSVIAEHLARRGVNLILVDRDYLEQNDAYSSSIYTMEQCQNSLPKARAADRHLSGFTDIEAHMEHLGPGNISILDSADIIVDGTDNLQTRSLINEYSKREETPWIYTAALGEKGYSMLFDQECFSCVFPEVDPGTLGTCENDGIMREVAALAATTSALKAVKHLVGKNVAETLDIIPSGERLQVESNGCPVCDEGNYEHLESSRATVSVCGENKFQVEREIGENAFDNLKAAGEVVADNDYLTRVEIKGREFTLFRSGRAIIEAEDQGHAEARFDELVGG